MEASTSAINDEDVNAHNSPPLLSLFMTWLCSFSIITKFSNQQAEWEGQNTKMKGSPTPKAPRNHVGRLGSENSDRIRFEWGNRVALALLLASNMSLKAEALVPSRSLDTSIIKQPSKGLSPYHTPSKLVGHGGIPSSKGGLPRPAVSTRRTSSLSATSVASGDVMALWSMSFLALQFAFQPVLTRAFATKKLVKTTYVIAQDLLRLLLCAMILTFSSGWSDIAGQWSVASSLVGAGLPASLYAIQNYCSLTAYQNLSPISYNVLNQTKTLSAAFFCYVLLSKPQSTVQIFSLFLLLISALIMEEVLPIRRGPPPDETMIPDATTTTQGKRTQTTHFTMGVLPILLASLISGLAGTLCQQTLQDFGRNPWLFSMEISFFSSIFLLGSLIAGNPDGPRILQGGVAQGWNRKTLIPLITNAIGGILVGLVTKYAGSVRKGFALVVGLLLSGVLQNSAEQNRVTREQWTGGVLAAVAIWMHVCFPIKLPR